MMLVRRTEVLGEQPVPMPRCPPQTPSNRNPSLGRASTTER